MLEPKDWRLHIAYFEMVLLYVDMRKYDKAEAILGDELQNCEHISRTSDVDISTASDDLFTLLNRIGLVCLCDSNPGRAEDFLTRALQGYEKRHGPDHLSTLDAVSNLAEVYIFQEKYEKAKEYNRRVRQGLEKIPEATNVSILASLHQQGKIYHNLERHEEAKEVFVRVANEYESTLESGRIETRIPALTNMEFLGDLLDDMGQKKEALSYYRRAGVGFVNLYGHDHERCQDLNRIIQSLEGW
ncbi:hypothetical protein B0T10DRAFT_473585 [Thelonectria olida]|uniref:Uncharacterized protein n=1 Tax=Thelonectria olida TaxID=1576542 RepID=A0A9P8WH57_9HYPO|nr:hypothetical protein B0T10DRAFT_473585 [Thelonectria olida]